MLLYKINEDKVGSRSGDYTYMLNLIKEDYRNYFNASEYLQNRYDFCIEAIYSCLSEVNHMNNRRIAYEALKEFLDGIKRINGLTMEIVKKEQLFVREKPKVKSKRYKLKKAI